jgi:hypothetical protein
MQGEGARNETNQATTNARTAGNSDAIKALTKSS